MSSIEWTDKTWNPVTGCTRVSKGCDNCYAVHKSHRLGRIGEAKRAKGENPGKLAYYEGLTVLNNRGDRHFNGTVRCVEEALTIPLGWKKPRLCFVNSMSDLFHRDVPFEFIDRVFAVMALCPQHTFQILTKRPERMAEYLTRPFTLKRNGNEFPDQKRQVAVYNQMDELQVGSIKLHEAMATVLKRRSWWPLPNVWLGTSTEDQAAADERIPHLLRCRDWNLFLSMEPLLSGVVLPRDCFRRYRSEVSGLDYTNPGAAGDYTVVSGISWVIVGGESGKGARPCNIDWIRSIRDQCRDAGVSCFVKQCGAKPMMREREWFERFRPNDLAGWTEADGMQRLELRDSHGGVMEEWPDDLRVREMPEVGR